MLIYHRPAKQYDLYEVYTEKVAKEIEHDMIQYGFLLPNFVPVLTRHLCLKTASKWQTQTEAMGEYAPYANDCFNKHPH